MKIATVKEFRDKASEMLRSDEPILVTRHGKAAGFYIPLTDPSHLPVELRRELFVQISDRIAQKLKDKGITEEEILDDFEAYRKDRGGRERDHGRTHRRQGAADLPGIA